MCNTSELSQLNIGTQMELSKFSEIWMEKSYTSVSKLVGEVSDTINTVWTVLGIWEHMLRQITVDGTSKCVYHGKNLRSIAGKLTTTYILEIRAKKDTTIGLNIDVPYVFGALSEPELQVRMTDVSMYGLTVKVRVESPLSATFSSVGEDVSVFLELSKNQEE